MKKFILISLSIIGLVLSFAALQISRGKGRLLTYPSSYGLNPLIFRFPKLMYLENVDDSVFYTRNVLVEFITSASEKDEVKILSSYGRSCSIDRSHEYVVRLSHGWETFTAIVELDKFESVLGAEPLLERYPMRVHEVFIAFKPLTPKILENKIIELYGKIDVHESSTLKKPHQFIIKINDKLSAGILAKQLKKKNVVEDAWPFYSGV